MESDFLLEDMDVDDDDVEQPLVELLDDEEDDDDDDDEEDEEDEEVEEHEDRDDLRPEDFFDLDFNFKWLGDSVRESISYLEFLSKFSNRLL